MRTVASRPLRAASSRALAAAAVDGCKGSYRDEPRPRQPSLPPRPTTASLRNQQKSTETVSDGTVGRFAVPFLCVHVCVLPPEASGVARTRPGPVFWDSSAAAASISGEGYNGRGGDLPGP